MFRAAKRRKLARHQQEHSVSMDSMDQPASPYANQAEERAANGNNNDQVEDDEDAPISCLIRARKHIRRPVTGVQFSTTKTARGPVDDTSRMDMTSNESMQRPIDITDRFVGSTGQVVNVDKHMFVLPSILPC